MSTLLEQTLYSFGPSGKVFAQCSKSLVAVSRIVPMVNGSMKCLAVTMNSTTSRFWSIASVKPISYSTSTLQLPGSFLVIMKTGAANGYCSSTIALLVELKTWMTTLDLCSVGRKYRLLSLLSLRTVMLVLGSN